VIAATVQQTFTQLQLTLGLSAPSLILLIIAVWKSLTKSLQECDTMAGVIAQVAFTALIWYLIGLVIINPLYNLILSGIQRL